MTPIAVARARDEEEAAAAAASSPVYRRRDPDGAIYAVEPRFRGLQDETWEGDEAMEVRGGLGPGETTLLCPCGRLNQIVSEGCATKWRRCSSR